MNLSNYIGLNYNNLGRDRSGVDCYGLVVLIFKEVRGIILPDFTHLEYQKEWYKKNDNHIVENVWADWREVSPPYKAWDGLLFYNDNSKSIVNHMGLLVNESRFIHIMEDHTSMLSTFGNFWKNRLYKVLRYKDEI